MWLIGNTFERYAAVFSQCLMIAGIGYTLVSSASYFLTGGMQTASKDFARHHQHESSSARASVDLVVAKDLFGVAEPSESSDADVEVAVETTLPLELHGVFVADSSADSAAILARTGRRGKLYRIGQALPGDAELLAVRPDHIVLGHAGAREILHFPPFRVRPPSETVLGTLDVEMPIAPGPAEYHEPTELHHDMEGARISPVVGILPPDASDG